MEAHEASVTNWDYTSYLEINGNSVDDAKSFAPIWPEKLHISERLLQNDITFDITPGVFEAKPVIVNFEIPMRPLKGVFFDSMYILLHEEQSDAQKDTLIDMSFKGMHMDGEIIDELKKFYLQYSCRATTEYYAYQNLNKTDWYCPCEASSIQEMPAMKLEVTNENRYGGDQFFPFESRDYFYYPYCGDHTLPAECKLSFSSQDEFQSKDYVLGQIFIRQRELVFDYVKEI